jgi:hypothetical protein
MATVLVESYLSSEFPSPSSPTTTMPPRDNVDYTRQGSVEDLLTSAATNDDFRMKRDDLETLRELPGNKFCIDCGAADPDWASVNLGIFMCLECSGIHR